MPAISFARDNKLILVETRPSSILTNTLSNSLGCQWAGGISLTFLSSTYLWRKVFAGFRLCWSLLSYFFSFSLKVIYCSSRRWNLGPSLSFCFYREPRACCFPLWSTIVVSVDWTNDVFSQSFAFLVAGLFISFEFLRGLFSGVNLIAYEIYWTCPSGNVLVNLVPKPLFLPN